MNHHSSKKSSFVSCDFVQKNKSDGKCPIYFMNKICKIKKKLGSFGKDLLKNKKGTNFKIKHILKSQEKSKDNFYPPFCPKSPSQESDIKAITPKLCDQLQDIAAENLNLLSLSQTVSGTQSDPNNESEEFLLDCFTASKKNSSLQAQNERTFTYCNSRQIASIEQETRESLHDNNELNSNIAFRELRGSKINTKSDNEGDKLNIGVKNEAAQESDNDVQSFGNVIAKYGSSDGDSNEETISIRNEADETEATASRDKEFLDISNANISIENQLNNEKKNVSANEIRISNYESGENNNEKETPRCNSSSDNSNVDQRKEDVRESDHTYMRQLSAIQPCGHNDHNNNDNEDIHNSTYDENDDVLFVQIDQSKIKAIKNEILSSFRISNENVEEKAPEKLLENVNKMKRKLDHDHYDRETKKIKIKDRLQSKRKKVRKCRNATKVCCKRNDINFSVGYFTEKENFEEMDTDDVTEISNKKCFRKSLKEEEKNMINYNEPLIEEDDNENEIMDICEENEIRISDESNWKPEEADEMDDKQNAFDELSDVIEEASDDQMGTSDADSRTQFTRNWNPSEFYDTETVKWRMDIDEGSEKLENKMEEVNESLETPKEDFINYTEDRKTRLRPRNYRTFLLTKEKRSRAFLKQRSRILGRWFVIHFNHPYPSKQEKEQLARESNMPRNQVSEWFGNMRRRIREATRGQHLTWEEKVRRYNNLISGKSEPLPILPGDLINSHSDEGTENANKHVDEQFSSEVFSPKFKRNLLQRYMNDYEIKSFPQRMNMTEEPNAKMSSIPNISTNDFKERNNSISNLGTEEESPKVGNLLLFPIWREIRINPENQADIKASEGEMDKILESIDCHSATSNPFTNQQSLLSRKRRSRNSQAFNRAGNLQRMWTQLPNDSNVFVLDQNESVNTTKTDQELQLDEDSNERPCSISKRVKANCQSSFRECEQRRTSSDNPRSLDEIDAAYSLMELQKI